MGISSIGRESFTKFSGLREIKIVKIVRKGAFAKCTFRENLYVHSIQPISPWSQSKSPETHYRTVCLIVSEVILTLELFQWLSFLLLGAQINFHSTACSTPLEVFLAW